MVFSFRAFLTISPVRVRLLRPQAIHVVLVAGPLPPYRQAVQLPPVPPRRSKVRSAPSPFPGKLPPAPLLLLSPQRLVFAGAPEPLPVVVAQGIPRRVVGDALPVKPRQQVLPVRVPVGVAVALQVLGRRSVLRLPRRQVPRSVL